MKKLRFLSFGAILMSLAVGVVTSVKSAKAVSPTYADDLPEFTVTSLSLRADSSNPGTNGVGPTFNVYTATTGSAAAAQYADTEVLIYDKTVGELADFSVKTAVFVAGQRFIMCFPDYLDTSKMSVNHMYSFYFKKGTVFGNSAKLAHDIAFDGNFYMTGSNYAFNSVSVYNEANMTFEEEIDTAASVKSTTYVDAEGYWKFNLTVNDIDGLTSHANANSLTNWVANTTDKAYNYLLKIKTKRTAADETYLPLVFTYKNAGVYFNEGCTYRLPVAAPYATSAKMQFIKIEAGCQFPSYKYLAGEITTKRCFKTTADVEYTCSRFGAQTNSVDYVPVKAPAAKGSVSYSAIVSSWNDANWTNYGGTLSGLVLQMSASGSLGSASNSRDWAMAMGDRATINGVPFVDAGVYLTYTHGNTFVFLVADRSLLVPANGYDICTIEIQAGVPFEDVYLPYMLITYDTTNKYTVVASYQVSSEFDINTGYGTVVDLGTVGRVSLSLDYPAELSPTGDHYSRPTVAITNLATDVTTNYAVIFYTNNSLLIDGWLEKTGNDATYKVTIAKGTAFRHNTDLEMLGFANELSFYVAGVGNGFFVYKDAEKANIESFIDNNLHFEDYDTGLTGAGDESCVGYYSTAKTAFASLTSLEKKVLCNGSEYKAAFARFAAWATANGETLNVDGNIAGQRVLSVLADSNNTMVIVISVLFVGFTAYAFATISRKRKHN